MKSRKAAGNALEDRSPGGDARALMSHAREDINRSVKPTWAQNSYGVKH
jgi:hypothetical protein